MYMQSGCGGCDGCGGCGVGTVALAHDVGPNQEKMARFVKTAETATGAVGVITYDLQDTGSGRRARTFALMFSVPYDFTFHSSWYAVGLWYDAIPCDYDLYYRMYYQSEQGWFHRRSADEYIIYTDARYTIKASMTNTFTPTIVVEFSD